TIAFIIRAVRRRPAGHFHPHRPGCLIAGWGTNRDVIIAAEAVDVQLANDRDAGARIGAADIEVQNFQALVDLNGEVANAVAAGVTRVIGCLEVARDNGDVVIGTSAHNDDRGRWDDGNRLDVIKADALGISIDNSAFIDFWTRL